MTPFNETSALWSDPKIVYGVAIFAIVLLAITIWLFRRSKRDGRAAGIICLTLSILLHAALIWLLPAQEDENGGSSNVQPDPLQSGAQAMTFSTFDPSLSVEDSSSDSDSLAIEPLPVAELEDLLAETELTPSADPDPMPEDFLAMPDDLLKDIPAPQTLATTASIRQDAVPDAIAESIESSLDELLQSQLQVSEAADHPMPADASAANPPVAPEPQAAATVASAPRPASVSPAKQDRATTPGSEQADFANRVGAAKQIALMQTGGDARTEAAVQAALRFLAHAQRDDGGWDPRSSGAGIERAPLGERRPGAGTKSTNGLTGLALLAMMGSGHTHLEGDYADNVYRGLVFLIRSQQPNGSLGGNATPYAASYCHSMASLAMCEAAVMTEDASAIECARRAIGYTVQMQHPVTGGWRYTRGDPGDLSQLGWQAMVLDGGKRSGIAVPRNSVAGIARFLRSVRAGRGGLASYRPGEASSRTMTAEALATRLLIGEDVPPVEIREAETYLMQSPPGKGQDNYYYWYYATLALHQLQDDAWHQWNEALKTRLLATQRPDGSWPSSTLWGGYGGTVYTTAMATLCLETYYRHAIR